MPLIPVMAAVANAIHNALGKRFYSLPMSPPKVLEVIEGSEAAERFDHMTNSEKAAEVDRRPEGRRTRAGGRERCRCSTDWSGWFRVRAKPPLEVEEARSSAFLAICEIGKALHRGQPADRLWASAISAHRTLDVAGRGN